MDLRKNIMMIVSVMVAVIIALAVLVPVIQDSSASEDKFTNDGYFRVIKLDSSSPDYTLTWNATNNKIVTVNGSDMEIPWNSTYPLSLIATESAGLRYTITLSTETVYLDLFGTQTNVLASVNDDATITLSGGTLTLSSTGDNDVTVSYTTAYGIYPNGEYVMKKSTDTAYVNGDSDIFSTGRTALTFGGSSAWFNINVSGNIEDGFNATVLNSPSATASNYVVDSSEVNAYKDLYTFTGVNFDVTLNDNVATASYSQVIVPYEVTAERSVHVSTIEASLLGIIPLLVVIGIVIGAVWFIRQKN